MTKHKTGTRDQPSLKTEKDLTRQSDEVEVVLSTKRVS
jgi:hypothetical protein